MAECVLVTDKEFAKAESVFKLAERFDVRPAPTEETALVDAIMANDCRAVIVGVDKYIGPLYEALGQSGGDKGAIIARYGVGHDGVDKTLARQHNIVVANTPGVLDISVAEHTIWLMGALARNIAKLDAKMRAGEFGSQMGVEVSGKTLGIIGFGAIGRRVAKIASFGLDMKVIAADVRQLDAGEVEKLVKDFGIETYTNDVEAVLRQADIISIHLPSIPETHHFFNADRIATMRPSAMLVNTARGPVVDECALYDALTSGQLAGAALDVFEQEPYTPLDAAKDLRQLGNVVFTPHIGSNTRESNDRMASVCLRNVTRFFAGQFDTLDVVETKQYKISRRLRRLNFGPENN